MTEIYVIIVEDGDPKARSALVWPEGTSGANLTTVYTAKDEDKVRTEYFSMDIRRDTIKSYERG